MGLRARRPTIVSKIQTKVLFVIHVSSVLKLSLASRAQKTGPQVTHTISHAENYATSLQTTTGSSQEAAAGTSQPDPAYCSYHDLRYCKYFPVLIGKVIV